MALNQQSLQNFQSWDVDMVTRWLGQINLPHLVPIFEQYDINGATLASMDEGFMKEQLRIHRPAELMALRGAISNLKQLEQAAAMAAAAATATVHQQRAEVPRHGSLGKRVAVGTTTLLPSSAPSSSYSSSSTATPSSFAAYGRSTTLPPNYSLVQQQQEHPKVHCEPMLRVGASAQELLDDSRHCGFITKQGGTYKNCTLSCCCVCSVQCVGSLYCIVLSCVCVAVS